MLAINDILKELKTYNIHSGKYEPTIYQNKDNIGICLDIKDSLFGYLTRIFLFKDKQELDSFLKSFFWYKENKSKYNIKLFLDNYHTKNPKIIYRYQKQPLTLDNMLNMDSFLKNEENEQKEEQERQYYLKSIQELTNYLINFKEMKEKIKLEKNNLKTEENDLKFELLTQLTKYYGKEKTLAKKNITLDLPTPVSNSQLLENIKYLETKNIDEIKRYLENLINSIKKEELEEKNLINIYSNSVYHYNIDILKKQIEFVKNKINAEKNFNLKGSKLHNIDAELRTFLKTDIAPTKIETFLSTNKSQIEERFKNVTIQNACEIITGKKIALSTNENIPLEEINPITYLENEFNKLPLKTQKNLILYHSLYKPICNYIIENNYPEFTAIEEAFDFNHYYKDLEEIVFHENNNHYLTNYFNEINFKNITSYINSIIEICKDLENTTFKVPNNLNLFAASSQNKYKQLTALPTKDTKYLITTEENLILIPKKLEIDWDNNEINDILENSYYTKDNIIEEIETITLAKYMKKNIKKDDIIITTDLLLESEQTFNKSHLEGENYG